MGKRFPAVNARQIVRVLQGLGFRLARQAGGSHAVFRRKSDGRRTVVPIHPRTVLKRKTLAAILDDIGISQDELRTLL